MKKNIEWVKYKELWINKPELFIEYCELEIIFEEKVIEKFELENQVKIGVVYESKFHMLIVDLIRTNEQLYTYERIIPINKGAIITVPMIDNKFLVLKQFRHAHREIQYSFPRGFGENGITSFENVKKELMEEVCGVTKNIEYLGKLTSDSGVIANIADVYFCELDSFGNNGQHEGIKEVILLDEVELNTWIREGRIIDNFTIAAFCLYMNR